MESNELAMFFPNKRRVDFWDINNLVDSFATDGRLIVDITPAAVGGGKRGAAPASAGEREGKMTRAEMLNKYEDDFKLSVLRLGEGTQDSFFNDIVAKLTKMKDENADVTTSKIVLRTMPMENLRHISDVLKFKELPTVTQAIYKGVFAVELERVMKVETDLKYLKQAMDTGMGILFIRQFHKGAFNWEEIGDEIMDAMQDVIKGSSVSAGPSTANAQVQAMTD